MKSARDTIRWTSGILACATSFAPPAQAKFSGLFSLQGQIEPDVASGTGLGREPQDGERSRFSFQQVWVAPQYAQQAETPLPLHWWEQGSDSPVAIAIGAAEGTRLADGGRTAAYYWHADPGNAADNFGSFSFQHLNPREKAVVYAQEDSDDKRWVSARRALPEVADRRQLERLRRFHDQLLAQARQRGLVLSDLELLNGLDLANQSELAALDRWGYIDRLAQAKRLDTDPDAQIRYARTWSYWHPTLKGWDAPGLGNTYDSIVHDQSRRADALKQVLEQERQRPTALDQLNPQALAQAPLDRPEDAAWSLAVAQDLAQAGAAIAAGFAPRPFEIPVEQPLATLIAETQQDQAHQAQLDAELATALAQDTTEADEIAQTILAVDSTPLLPIPAPLPETPLSEISVPALPGPAMPIQETAIAPSPVIQPPELAPPISSEILAIAHPIMEAEILGVDAFLRQSSFPVTAPAIASEASPEASSETVPETALETALETVPAWSIPSDSASAVSENFPENFSEDFPENSSEDPFSNFPENSLDSADSLPSEPSTPEPEIPIAPPLEAPAIPRSETTPGLPPVPSDLQDLLERRSSVQPTVLPAQPPVRLTPDQVADSIVFFDDLSHNLSQ